MKSLRKMRADFKKKYNFVEMKCCENCKHMRLYYGVRMCEHKELRTQSDDDYISIAYFYVLGINVCGAWEKSEMCK
jgi:hypothetical protein